jgi:hypothetical protein
LRNCARLALRLEASDVSGSRSTSDSAVALQQRPVACCDAGTSREDVFQQLRIEVAHVA